MRPKQRGADKLRHSNPGVADERSKFEFLAERWERETAGLSTARAMAQHPAYQAIIQMGDDALRPIFSRLEKRPEHWFIALRAITGTSPVRPEDAGDVGAMVEAWLQWAREHGYAD